MIDTRATFSSLLNDPKLDALLSDAQTKIAAQADRDPESLDRAVEDVQVKAAQIRRDLVNNIQAKEALRCEKVAIAIHMMKVATKLSA